MTSFRGGKCVTCGAQLSPDPLDLIPPLGVAGFSIGVSCKQCGRAYDAPKSWIAYGVVLGFLAWFFTTILVLGLLPGQAAIAVGAGALVFVLTYAGTIHAMLRISRGPAIR